MVGLHVTFVLIRKNDDDDVPLVDWQLVTVPTSLLTFTMVFYSGQCYTRFFKMYEHCVSIQVRFSAQLQ